MENTSIFINYRGKLEEKLSEVKEIMNPYKDNPTVQRNIAKLEDIYASKLKDIKPQIMVYGIYNAGKSSIINELIKDDRAGVADRPMTDRVDYYEWNGYMLADTPGVGAPIEHEDVTTEHLEKADVVIFVMSTNGSTERKQNYDRMKDIVNAGKKIIIVLNDKEGVLEDPADRTIPTIKMQVVENMKAVGITNANDFCIVTVNAKRAHKGRTENKKNLYIKSHIEELEKVILSELRATTPFMIMHNCIVEVEKHLECMIAELQGNNDDEINKLNSLLNNLRSQKKIVRNSMKEYVQARANHLGRELPEVIWPIVKAEKEQEIIKENVNSVVMDSVAKECERIQDELQLQLKESVENLQVEIEDYKELLEKRQSKIDVSLNVKELKIDDSNLPEIPVKSDDLISTLDTVSMAAKMAGEFIKTTAGKTMLKFLGGTVLGKTVLAPLTTVVGPILGPAGWIVTGISILKSLLGGGNEEGERMMAEAAREAEIKRRQVEAEQQYRQELQQKCQYMSEDLADTLLHDISNTINEVFGKLEAPFKESLTANKEAAASMINACNELNRIYGEYDIIDTEIAAKNTGL